MSAQEFPGKLEFVFVDDASTDGSIPLIQKLTAGWPDVHIILNKENKGPAIRLNQGCKIATGRFLFLMDSDDLLAPKALKAMFDAMHKEQADFFYGGWKRLKPNVTFECPPLKNFVYTIASPPLLRLLQNNYAGMAMMVDRQLFLKAGGADERLFIQDLSVALRLSLHANKLFLGKNTLVWAPTTPNQLSPNRTQRGPAFQYMLELLDQIGGYALEKKWLFRRLVSVVWKARRSKILWWPFFLFYAFVKYVRPRPFGVAFLARCLP